MGVAELVQVAQARAQVGKDRGGVDMPRAKLLPDGSLVLKDSWVKWNCVTNASRMNGVNMGELAGTLAITKRLIQG